MFKVLFATDGSPVSQDAGRFLGQLPLPAGAAVHVVSVVLDWVGSAGMSAEQITFWTEQERLLEVERERGARTVEQAAAALARDGVAVTTAVRVGNPAKEILAAADEFDADLVVVGSEGLTGLAGFMLGSVARNVAHHSRRPVLVGRAPRHDLRAVVLAMDESDHAVTAARFMDRLPLPAAAEIFVTHVVRPEDVPEEQRLGEVALREALDQLARSRHDQAATLVGAEVARLEALGKRPVVAIRTGDPAAEILKLAEERGADLIVAGARGVSGFRSLFVGSVADRLLKFAPCSVLIVP